MYLSLAGFTPLLVAVQHAIVGMRRWLCVWATNNPKFHLCTYRLAVF